MGIGIYAGLRPVQESYVQEPVVPALVNETRQLRNALSLFGNGDLGQIANLQAGLNHSGLLDDSCLFVVSDVVDAVNYKTGDVSPVQNGLLERYCRAVKEGRPLAASPAVQRVLPLVESYWRVNYAEEYPDLKIRVEPMPWIEELTVGLGAVVDNLRQELHFRQMFANGPVSWLVHELSDPAYEWVLGFNQRHSQTWKQHLQEREAAVNMAATDREMFRVVAEWEEKTRQVTLQLQCVFLGNIMGLPIAEQAERFAAWQQIEALRGTRIAAGRPVNFRLMVWDWEKLPKEIGERRAELEESRTKWAREMPIESLVVSVQDEELLGGIRELLTFRWDGAVLVGGECRIAVLDGKCRDLLNWRREGGDRYWQYVGRVGGDGLAMVLVPMSN